MLALLKKLPFLQNFNEEELSLLLNIGECINYAPDDYICKEGDTSDEVFILLFGKINIVKWDTENQREYHLRTVSPGEVFAEMTFFDKIVRPCSIKAKEPCLILVISLAKVREYQYLLNKITSYISQLNVNRLRQRNENFVKSLQAELKEANLLNEFGKFFIIIILAFGFCNSINQLVPVYGVNVKTGWFNWGYLIMLVMPILFFVRRFNYPMSTFGVTFQGWQKSLFDGVWMSIVGVASILGIYFSYLYFKDPVLLQQFDFYNSRVFTLFTLNYFFHSYIQEFIARGVIQTSLTRFLRDDKQYQAIFITAGLFSIFHMHLGFLVGVITFTSGVLFGLIYSRHKNLLGVTLVHFFLGTSATYLGFM